MIKNFKEKSKPTNPQSLEKNYLKVYLFPYFYCDDFKVVLATVPAHRGFSFPPLVLQHQFFRTLQSPSPKVYRVCQGLLPAWVSKGSVDGKS